MSLEGPIKGKRLGGGNGMDELKNAIMQMIGMIYKFGGLQSMSRMRIWSLFICFTMKL